MTNRLLHQKIKKNYNFKVMWYRKLKLLLVVQIFLLVPRCGLISQLSEVQCSQWSSQWLPYLHLTFIILTYFLKKGNGYNIKSTKTWKLWIIQLFKLEGHSQMKICLRVKYMRSITKHLLVTCSGWSEISPWVEQKKCW